MAKYFKQNIEVRKYDRDQYGSKTTYMVVDHIKRKLWAEQIGNFNPLFCTFNKKRNLVKSDDGDLSDPFRREQNYVNSLYIEV